MTDDPNAPSHDSAASNAGSSPALEIVAALFMDDIELTSVPGPSTRIELSGIQFSAPAPAPVPCSVAPHLVVLVWSPKAADSVGAAAEPVFGALTVEFRLEGSDPAGEPLARNVQPLEIERGKFNYRLVRADLPFDDYTTVIAHCRIDNGVERRVPYTLLPPVG